MPDLHCAQFATQVVQVLVEVSPLPNLQRMHKAMAVQSAHSPLQAVQVLAPAVGANPTPHNKQTVLVQLRQLVRHESQVLVVVRDQPMLQP